MKARCSNRRYHRFKHYGGRGIEVCERWRGMDGFAAFLADLGPRPEGKTLDRRDVNDDYRPGNVRWADAETQNGNQQRHAA